MLAVITATPTTSSLLKKWENMVHPGGFEPPTARFVAEYSIQLSYGCIGKFILLLILISLLKPYQVRDGASGRIRTSDRSVRSRVLYPAELRMHQGELLYYIVFPGADDYLADHEITVPLSFRRRWCIRGDDSLRSPCGPLLTQRYPPWYCRLFRRP